MKISEKGRAFIIDYEKKRPEAYKDSAGKWTIGVGHLITDVELTTNIVCIGKEATPWRTAVLTNAQMDALFAQDIAPREKTLMTLLKREPTQQQFDAMSSLMFNIGEGAFSTSSVLRNFNLGLEKMAADSFALFNKVTVRGKKTVNVGLVKRRAQEKAMFIHGDYTSTH